MVARFALLLTLLVLAGCSRPALPPVPLTRVALAVPDALQRNQAASVLQSTPPATRTRVPTATPSPTHTNTARAAQNSPTATRTNAPQNSLALTRTRAPESSPPASRTQTTPILPTVTQTATHSLSTTLVFAQFTATATRGLPTFTHTPTHTPSATTDPRRPTPDLSPVLPDLRMLEPKDLAVQILDETRLLLMSHYIFNAGRGTLEVLGKSDSISQRTIVTQHVYRSDGSFTERPAGIFLFHPTHNHWHVDNFARYEIWSLTEAGELGDLVALSDKVSYCLRDTGRSTLAFASREPEYLECEAELQGISPGWVDSYTYEMPGQSVDITDLSDGFYAVQSLVDPSDRFLETNEFNNSSLVYFELKEDRVRTLDRDQLLDALSVSE